MFQLTIMTDNAAFAEDPNGELARILRQVAKEVEEDGRGANTVRDVNGNRVGAYSIGETSPDLLARLKEVTGALREQAPHLRKLIERAQAAIDAA